MAKGSEVTFEAIPNLIIQSVALLQSEKKTQGAIFSLVTSACSTALAATTMSYITDVSAAYRRESPSTCGMIPDTGRLFAFVVMFVFCVIHIVSKTLSTALLFVTNPLWLMYYMIGDMGFYFAQKIVRRDFILFIPLPLAINIPMSMLIRIGEKQICDFTGCLVMRRSWFLGGIYFSFNLAMTQISIPICVNLYHTYYDGEDELDEMTTGIITASLLSLWLTMFVYLVFVIIVPKYRKTFWNTQTGGQYSQSLFIDNEGNDEFRSLIFTTNAAHWQPIEEEVQVWCLSNWSKWEAEKPEWFNAGLKASIPDDFIPAAAVVALGGVARERRASANLSKKESGKIKVLSEGEVKSVVSES
jgi:hypothetical protein